MSLYWHNLYVNPLAFLSSWKAQGRTAEPKAVCFLRLCYRLKWDLKYDYHIVNESLGKYIVWLNDCLLLYYFQWKIRFESPWKLLPWNLFTVRVLGNKDNGLLFCSLASFPWMRLMYTNMLQAGIYSKIVSNIFRNIFTCFHDYLHPTIWPVLQFCKWNKLHKNYHDYIIFLGQWH